MQHFMRLFSYVFLVQLCYLNGTLLFAQSAAATESEALSLLINAYQNGGFNPLLLNSGVAEFEVTMSKTVKTAALQKSEAEKDTKEQHQSGVNTPKKGSEIAKLLSSDAIDTATRLRTRILFSGNDRYYGNQSGEYYKRLYENSLYFPHVDRWTREIILSYGHLVILPNDSRESLMIRWAPDKRESYIWSGAHCIAEFQLFGRFQEDGIVAELIRQKLDRKTFVLPADSHEYLKDKIQALGLSVNVVDEVGYDDGAKAKVIELKKADKLLEKYHIDVERGFLCPFQFVANESGTNIFERTATDFFQEKNTGFFYPQKFRKRIHIANLFVGVEEYSLVPDTLRLNQPVSDKEFAIDIPEDASVYDFRKPDEQTRYIAAESGTISLTKDGYDPAKLSWLVREERLEDYVPPTGGASGRVRWFLMSGGAVMVLVALYLKWKKRVA